MVLLFLHRCFFVATPFEVFIPISFKNSSAHIYVVEHGNKILTAMSGITGCSSVTKKNMCPAIAYDISIY
jgi:hypothetical protein